MEQYISTGTIVYNKVVAEGEGQNGTWYRSEVVIECIAPNTGKTYCKIFQYFADKRLPMAVGMKGEFKWFVDKKEWNGKTLSSCKIVDYKPIDDEPQQTALRQAPQPTEQPQPQQPTQTEIPF